MTCTAQRKPLAAALSELAKVSKERRVRLRIIKGHLLLSATDGRTWLHLNMEASGELADVCVSGSRLSEAVNSFGADLLGFQIDGQSFKIFAGKGKRTLPTMPVEDFPDPEFDGRLVLSIHADKLSEVFDFTLPHVAREEDIARAHVSAVFLFTDGGKLKAIGTDGSEFSFIEIAEAAEPVDLPIPGYLAEIASRLIFGDVEISATGRAVEFRWAGGVLRGQRLEKPVPVEMLAERTKRSLIHTREDIEPFSVSVEAPAFRASLRSVQGFGEADKGSGGRRVKMTLNGTATLSTSAFDGAAEESVPMDLSEARDLELGFSSTRMERVLRGFGDRVLTISFLGLKFDDPKLPDLAMKFEAAGQPDRVALLFPMKI